jgi:Flp pilus assembly secretin CpaC
VSAGARNRPPKGYTRSDERLREDICESLMHSPFIDAGEVSVAVKEGKVTLEGSVPERSMKHRIEDIAEQCSGVKDVDNRIRIARDQGEHGLWGSSGSSASESTRASGASSAAPHASTGKTR